jgi:signal transduction histidine kinase
MDLHGLGGSCAVGWGTTPVHASTDDAIGDRRRQDVTRGNTRTVMRLRDRATTAAARRFRIEPTRFARLAAVGFVPVTAVWMGEGLDLPVYIAVTLWVILSDAVRTSRGITVVDLGVAATLTYGFGGLVSPYLFLILVMVAGAGTRHGGLSGATGGAVISLTQLLQLTIAGGFTVSELAPLLPALCLLPLAGLTAGLATRVAAPRRGRAVLEEANRLLVDLQRVAADMPGGLDVATVSAAALAEIRALASPATAAVYTGRGGLLYATASTGTSRPPAPVHAAQIREVVAGEPHRLFATPAIRGRFGAVDETRPYAVVVPLRNHEVVLGAFVVGYDDLASARRGRDALVRLADDTALALDNAQRFDGATARAADAARRRIAHDLHDSVAQSLAHIKMELELLSLDTGMDTGLRDETERLSRVAGRALDEVRATITGLRSAGADDGLVLALRRHVDDLRTPTGPRLAFEATDGADVGEELRSDLLHVAQEAISNALRHADARQVGVSLEIDDELVQLDIEDDGRGIHAPTRLRPGHGVGLRAMHERAAAIGGHLTIRDRVGGGTVVSLRIPVDDRRRPKGEASERRIPVGR